MTDWRVGTRVIISNKLIHEARFKACAQGVTTKLLAPPPEGFCWKLISYDQDGITVEIVRANDAE